MFPCPRRIWESFKCTSRQQLRVWRLSHQLWLESRIRVGSAPTLVSSCGGHGKTCAQALQAAWCVLEEWAGMASDEWAGMASDERYGVDGAKLRDRLGFALSCNDLDLVRQKSISIGAATTRVGWPNRGGESSCHASIPPALEGRSWRTRESIFYFWVSRFQETAIGKAQQQPGTRGSCVKYPPSGPMPWPALNTSSKESFTWPEAFLLD